MIDPGGAPRPQNKGDRLRPANAEERQAAATLHAAKEVAFEIEKLKAVYRDEKRPARERQQVKLALFEATERLCNVMALAVFQLSASLSSDFQQSLTAGFTELRQRLLQMGVHLMVDRIDKINKRAAGVLEGNSYPIGLAMRLHAAYVDLTTNLRSLDAEEMLNESQQKLILDTAGMIDKLAEIEERLGMIMELEPDAEVPMPAKPAKS